MKNNRLKWIFLFLFIFWGASLKAKTIYVEAVPGGSVLLPESIKDAKVIVSGQGRADAPFIIGSKGKKSILTGESFIKIGNQCKNIVIRDIEFLNNLIKYRESTSLIEVGDSKRSEIENIIIERTEFIFNKPFVDKGKGTQFHWINIFGNNVTVKDCIFKGKRNRLPIIHINSNFKDVLIENNVFKDVPPRNGGALEAIRIGLIDGPSNALIINNKFLNYHGDSETISIKADNVRVIGNEFTACRSGISIRYADNCIINKNIFNNTTTPLRMVGTGHLVFNNVFNENESSSSITFMMGGQYYPDVKDITFYGNVFNTEKFILRMIQFPNHNEPPKDLRFEDNYFNNKKLKNEFIRSLDQSKLLNQSRRRSGLIDYSYKYK